MTDKSEFVSFVTEAITCGWPDNTIPRTDTDFPGFYGGQHTRGNWRYLDIWSGGSTDAGMMVVFRAETAVWICTYRGGILPTEHLAQTVIAENELFNFLAEALRAEGLNIPRLRGPARYTSSDGRWQYTFKITGTIDSFWASEQIYEQDVLGYERILLGGRVGDGVPYGTGSLLADNMRMDT